MRMFRSFFTRTRPTIKHAAHASNPSFNSNARATSSHCLPHAGERVGAYDELTAKACRYAADAYLDPVPTDRVLVSDRDTDAQAVVDVLESGAAVVAFRGSESHKDWVHNAMVPLRSLPSPHRGSVRAHAGFLRQYTSLHARLLKLLRERGVDHVTLCGHSLGGALAVIAAAMLPEKITCDVITFGAPRAGNDELSAAAYNRCVECVRVVHDRDVVPTMPLGMMGYAHVCDPWLHLDENGFVTEKPVERSVFEQFWLRTRGVAMGDFGIRDHFMCKYLRGTARSNSQATEEVAEKQSTPMERVQVRDDTREEDAP